MVIDQSLTIVGSGASTTIIDGGGITTPTPDAVVTLSELTLRNGGGVGDGGDIYNCMTDLTTVNSVITNNFATSGMGSLGYGQAIYNCPGSTLTIINSTSSWNRALAGGAICNGGVLTTLDSTFSQNVARAQKGCAIFNYGNLMVANNTFTGNRVPGGGGGDIHNGELIGQKANATISNSTVSGNTAASGKGGGIFSLKGAVTTVQNSIVSGNSGGNCSGLIAAQGYDLSSDNPCSFKGPGALNSVDPRLGPLQDNGGPTETMALRPESPAIDAGNSSGCFDGQGDALITDQGGEPRPDSEDRGGCDIGATSAKVISRNGAADYWGCRR